MPYPEKLKKTLDAHCIDPGIVEEIFKGYERIEDSSPKLIKIAFMRRAMNILDRELSYGQRYELLDECACCLGGVREKNVKRFVHAIEGQSLSLSDKVAALREARPFYNSTRMNADGSITDGIYHEVDGEYRCVCPNLNNVKLVEPLSLTYLLRRTLPASFGEGARRETANAGSDFIAAG